MMKVEWKDEYNIGIPSIDRQHQKLFIYLADLREALVAGEREDAIRKAIQNLLDYGIEHFAFEEDILKKGSFESFDKHQESHNRYNEKLLAYKNKFIHGDEVMATDLIIFIKRWLVDHILVDDMKYIDAFKESGFSCPEMELTL